MLVSPLRSPLVDRKILHYAVWVTRSVGHQESENHGDDSALSHAIEEGRPSRWKDGLTRLIVHRSPIDDWKVGRSFWLKASWGQGSKDWAVVS